jgi:LacI family transcriptional regulator
MNPVNLKKLAEVLNLSISTISKALSDSHEIGAETKKRVRALAQELNYEPNPHASSLRRNKSNTIGVIIPEVANNFFSLAINGIEEVARENGYHVLIYLTHDSYTREVDIVQHLAGGRVDGLLMSVSGGSQNFSHLADLEKRGVPMVFFDRICEQIATAQVTTNDYHGGYLATQHLIEAGCRRIAHLLISGHLSIGRKRMQGYQDALKDAGIAFDPVLVLNGDANSEENTAAITALLTQHPDIDGIFASVEHLAISTYWACQSLGRRIPEDVKVVGFSNLAVASLLAPALTTITQPAYNIGVEAARILFKAIKKNKPVTPTQSVELKSELIARKSTQVLAW